MFFDTSNWAGKVRAAYLWLSLICTMIVLLSCAWWVYGWWMTDQVQPWAPIIAACTFVVATAAQLLLAFRYEFLILALPDEKTDIIELDWEKEREKKDKGIEVNDTVYWGKLTAKDMAAIMADPPSVTAYEWSQMASRAPKGPRGSLEARFRGFCLTQRKKLTRDESPSPTFEL